MPKYTPHKTKHSLYGTWNSMKRRCDNPNYSKYHLYGGRGISICPEWRDFWQFVADVGEKPSAQHTLDRYPDMNGNYEPGNVRWATYSEQAINSRKKVSTRWMTLNGVTKSQADWARELGMSVKSMTSRRKYGWSDEKILSTPINPIGTNQHNQ